MQFDNLALPLDGSEWLDGYPDTFTARKWVDDWLCPGASLDGVEKTKHLTLTSSQNLNFRQFRQSTFYRLRRVDEVMDRIF